MSSIRKIFGFLMSTLVLGVFALSSGAALADKTYTLAMSPTTGTSPIATMTATFTNTGNSTFNSFTLNLPTGYSLTGTPTFSSDKGQVSYNSGTRVITVTNIGLPVGAGSSEVVTVTMHNVASTGGTCTGTPSAWVAHVYGGSSLNGAPFSGNSPTTTIAPSCYTVTFDSNGGSAVSSQNVPSGGTATVPTPPTKANNTFAGWYDQILTTAFNFITPITGPITLYAKWTPNTLTITSAPTSAAVGTPFDVVVANNPGGAVVTIDVAACPGATSTSTTTGNPVTSTKFTVTVPSMPGSGVCGLTFNATNYVSVTMSPIKVYKGVLDCGDYDSINGPGDPKYDPDLPSSDPNMGTSYVGTPGWGLRRGPNRDGAGCVKVNYSCDLTATTTDNFAVCTFDKGVVDALHPNGQLATFKYLFLWASRPNADGWTNFRPQVSWGVANPDTTSANAYQLPDWVPLLACLDGDFPSLPTLPTTILPVIPSVSPFTDAANTRSQYQPNGQVALVCGFQQGFTAVGGGKLQHWDIIGDESDMQVKGP